MKTLAVVIREPGGPEVLDLAERELREPGPGEVRIEVAASALNRADLLQRRGLYPAPAGVPADIPGLEYAGVVAEAGEGTSRVRVGDHVMGITGGGGMAQYLVAHESEVMPVPRDMPLAQAAAIPEVFLTAYDALFEQCGVSMGDDVLIHAAASGVGTAAIQLCIASGARPIGTSRSNDKLARARELGLECAIPIEGGAFSKKTRAMTGGRGARVVLDTVGGAYLKENLRAVASCGHIVVIGLLGGAKAELELGLMLAKRVTLRGTVLRSRPLEEKAALTQRAVEHLVPLFERGLVRPVIDDTMKMADIQEAHRRMEANETFGKLVLAW